MTNLLKSKEEDRKKKCPADVKELFGIGKGKNDLWWKDLVKQLRMKGFIQEVRFYSISLQ